MKEQQLTEQQVNEIKAIRDEVSKLTVKLGQLEINKMILQESVDDNISEINKVKASFNQVRESENKILKELTDLYGEHTMIDIDKKLILLK